MRSQLKAKLWAFAGISYKQEGRIMGFRFRKSINLGGGFRVNLSKSGVGYSWGTKGLRVTKTAKGKSRVTASIPGTGISYVAEDGGKRKVKAKKASTVGKTNVEKKTVHYKMPLIPNIVIAVASFGICIGYYLLHGYEVGISIASGLLIGVALYIILYGVLGALLMTMGIGETKAPALGSPLDSTDTETITTHPQTDGMQEAFEVADVGYARQNSAPEMMPLTKEVFEIPGAFHNRANIAKVMEPNPAWRKTCKVLIKSGIGDKRVYRFRPTTRAAQLVAEPNNPYSDNAVMVQIDGLKVGYIADDEASHVNDILKNKTIVDVSAAITGGEYKLILSEEKMAKYTVGPFIKVTVQYH